MFRKFFKTLCCFKAAGVCSMSQALSGSISSLSTFSWAISIFKILPVQQVQKHLICVVKLKMMLDRGVKFWDFWHPFVSIHELDCVHLGGCFLKGGNLVALTVYTQTDWNSTQRLYPLLWELPHCCVVVPTAVLFPGHTHGQISKWCTRGHVVKAGNKPRLIWDLKS